MTSVLAERCRVGGERIRRNQRERERIRQQDELVRLWDGEWALHHLLGNEYSNGFTWISNDTGQGRIEVDFDSPQGFWIYDQWGRMERGEKRNVHITVDDAGARWGGRLGNCTVEDREDGSTVVVADFDHDYENLKWVTCWSNPFLGPAFQAPKAYVKAGPVGWLLKDALHVNLLRMHNPLITIPDDPMDFDSYLEALDMSTWDIVVKPESFAEGMDSGQVWGVFSSRWANWHDAARVMLEDAELSVVCRRYLQGDPPPWDGANLRHGTLVVDIVDKSGVYVGTSNGGNMWDGLSRTIAEFSEDFIDSTENLFDDNDIPREYLEPGNRLTHKEWPFAVYLQGSGSGIESSAFVNSPAKGDTVAVGGHSMPGVNEAISASIQAAGDIVGNIVMIGSLGGTIDTLLKPLYEDTVLAWHSHKSVERAQNSGWSRYHDYFQDGASRAYTISSLMVLRAGFWATKSVLSNQLSLRDGAPFIIGDNGVGHWFLDDRIGFSLENDPTGRIWVDRARKIQLKRTAKGKEWIATVGDPRILQDPATRAWGKIETMIAALRDLGVY